MANVSYHIYHNLNARNQESQFVNVGDIHTARFWKTIFSFRPDVIHFIPGPTLKGLLFVKFLKLLTSSKIVVSATKPALPGYFRIFSGILRPDVIIVQSKENERFFKNLRYRCAFIPNGVDTDKFAPVPCSKKLELRRKFNLNEADFIMLHVGPVKAGRNQESLLKIQGAKLLLIASITNPSEEMLYNELVEANVTVWKEYFPDIQEIYALADAYVFPVFEKLNSIEIPLSVLEAMACNLPVITTRYGGLESLFTAGEGLFFMDAPDQIQEMIKTIKRDVDPKTRDKVLPFSWKNVVSQISQIYEELVLDRR